jgi:hypothetical protein
VHFSFAIPQADTHAAACQCPNSLVKQPAAFTKLKAAVHATLFEAGASLHSTMRKHGDLAMSGIHRASERLLRFYILAVEYQEIATFEPAAAEPKLKQSLSHFKS